MSEIRSLLSQHESYIRHRVEVDGVGYRDLSEELQRRFPGERGCSVRSIECFCKEKGIHKSSRLAKPQVRQVVAQAVAKVILSYVYIPHTHEYSLDAFTQVLLCFVHTGWTNIWS